MSFLKPVHVGDLVTCFVQLLKQGKTSMTIQVEVWVNLHHHDKEHHLVTTGTFICVAIDEKGQPRAVKPSIV